ncbi:2-hydroxyacid dehydrogenase [Pseudooceanicola nanhaiensis]|uniref:2-hydroxyacid dehydrogenase n=1 Tax=Pseudooceanicola nanhaiensis TaxID=375761 RepID=UPI001CD289D1|nr:D-glycerate dehydrogenase [Pseudooceanicola nanhaiensis]MCA0919419.1 D-glycerate dehydrogenase [Pseudooceanicola nanhaiensis]
MKRILITRPLPAAVLARAEATYDVELREKNEPMKRAEMRASLALYDGVLMTLGDNYGTEVLADSEHHRCKILSNFGVGFNHIDISAAAASGITVTNTPGAVTDATADIAMTLILMSCRRAGEGERLLRAGHWQGWYPTELLGLHVTGRTVGIVGMGNIGQAIARRCHHGFGMTVKYFNRSPKDVGFPAEKVESLTDLAGSVDILVVAVPGGADTRHLINGQVLAAMQSHAHLVNIARGEIVEEAALIAALEAGQIAGAGLDVYEFEPEVPLALRSRENVTLLPHLGTASEEVRTDMGMMALDNLDAFFAGETPPNAVS